MKSATNHFYASITGLVELFTFLFEVFVDDYLRVFLDFKIIGLTGSAITQS